MTRPNRALRIWKSAIQQTWKSALRFLSTLNSQLTTFTSGIATAKSLVSMEPESQDNPGSPDYAIELKAILVVDDDKQLASALQWILADQNFLVDVAFDGKEALLKLSVNQYDLVICDLIMPGVRGDEFYLKARDARPDLADRFIFITGFGTDPRIHAFLARHEVKYLLKPFPVEGLIRCVKEALA